jgi:hypothetical protein
VIFKETLGVALNGGLLSLNRGYQMQGTEDLNACANDKDYGPNESKLQVQVAK